MTTRHPDNSTLENKKRYKLISCILKVYVKLAFIKRININDAEMPEEFLKIPRANKDYTRLLQVMRREKLTKRAQKKWIDAERYSMWICTIPVRE